MHFVHNKQDLTKQIEDYKSTYDPEDQTEWNQVLNEIKDFIEVGLISEPLVRFQSQSSWKTSGPKTLTSEILAGPLKIGVTLWRKYPKSLLLDYWLEKFFGKTAKHFQLIVGKFHLSSFC